MELHRALGHDQLVGDLFVLQTAHEQSQHVQLASGERACAIQPGVPAWLTCRSSREATMGCRSELPACTTRMA